LIAESVVEEPRLESEAGDGHHVTPKRVNAHASALFETPE